MGRGLRIRSATNRLGLEDYLQAQAKRWSTGPYRFADRNGKMVSGQPTYIKGPSQAMPFFGEATAEEHRTASKPADYIRSVCRQKRMLRGMRRGLAAADLVTR